jgi:glycosyltransferase involved in cell wall biosynthesis
MKKILLLSDMPPTNSYTGGIVLEQLFRNLPLDSFCCYSAIASSVHPVLSDEMKDMDLKLDRKPIEYVLVGGARLRRLRPFFMALGFIKETYCSLVKVPKLKKRILQYCKDKNIGTVFCVLQGQTMLRLAEPIARELNAKLVVMVWDSLDWWLKHHNIDSITRETLHKQLASTMAYASVCATASQGMSDYYHQLYKTRCIPLIYSVGENNIIPPNAVKRDPNNFVIGFAGQLYAYSTMVALIYLLEKVNWVVEGVNVEIVLLGEGHEHLAKKFKHVHFMGWRNQDTLLPSLAEFDALYLPYMFEEKFKTEMQTSFPSKLVTYFAAGKPVFFHGPAYSSALLLLKEYKAGIICDSLAKANIYNSLARLVKDDRLRAEIVNNANSLLHERFTLAKQKELFFECLDIEQPESDTMLKAA